MHVEIESTANPRVKAWIALRKRSERDRTGTFLVEGQRETERALDHLDLVTMIVRSDRDDVAMPKSTYVSDRVFDRISARQNPDGVAAVFRTPHLSVKDLPESNAPLVLVADGVEKPGNIGAMIRTCDALGAWFIGSSLGTDLVNPNVVRSAQGSLFSTPIAVGTRTDVIAWCTDRTSIVTASPDATDLLWALDMSQATTIVIGAEHDGITSEWLDVSTVARLPMLGSADSLNASVAAAVFLAEAVRQRSV